MTKDFVPQADAELRAWLLNLSTTIATNGSDVGLSADEIAEMQSQTNTIISAIDMAATKKGEAKRANDDKESKKKAKLKPIRDRIAVLKKNAGYTEATGKLLGVVASEVSSDPSLMKPTLTATTSVAGVTVSFDKGQSQGVNIYGQRGAETIATFLARDTYSPYVDNRAKLANGEMRKYHAIYVIDDEEVGQASDIISIAV
jgi:hypothetical protein